ncbi:MAG: hypothetical protein M3314_00210 [Actinomycetota bacterium]|nr:hypothetical protein [Actinomycetota bacterium]
MILVALLAVVGSSSSFSADEGAAIAQARSLADGEGWIVEHPVPEADPAGANYPLEFSERGPRGFAPFGKHPLYALLLAGVDRIAGVAGMVLLSLAGTVAAAGLAAGIARRIDPALARPAVWTVGLASPLLFDGYLVIAHTLGAALAAAAMLATVVAIERRRAAVALSVLPLVAGAVLLRREAILLALALGLVAAVLAVRRPGARRPAGVIALGAPAVAAAAQVLEQMWTRHLLGGSLAWSGLGTSGTGSSGLIEGRLHAFFLTWLTPGYGARSLAPLALLVMLGAVAVAALALRRLPDPHAAVNRWAAVAAGAAVVAVLTGPTTVVPGFLVAFPLAAGGFLLIRRETLRTATAQVGLGVFALFALGVIGTQYTKGGAGEWGGRYFAIGIPFLAPVLLLALHDAGSRLGRQVRQRAVASLAVCSLVLATMGVAALRHNHSGTAELVGMFEKAGQAVGTEGGDRPVLVSTQGSAPRFAWPVSDRQRWLLSDPAGIPDLFGRLRVAGVTRIGFVTRDLSRDGPLLAPSATILSTDETASDRGWHVLVLQLP